MKLTFVLLALVALAGCAQPDKTVLVEMHSLPEGRLFTQAALNLEYLRQSERRIADEKIAR